MADIYMRILVSAQSSAGSVIRQIASEAAAAKASLALMAGVGVLAVGAALAYSVVQAANFQQGLNRLVTGAGDTTDNMQKLGQGILGVSVDTGVMTDKLLPAMYLILSSSQRGSQALDTLKAAAQGAQIEQANLTDVTSALTTMQNNWGVSTYTAAQYMNGLIVAVSGGRITLEDLTKYMGPILPIAKQMGISFQDVAAAMSVQTNYGLKAAQSATGLQAVFVNLEKPTKAASAAMLKYGVDSMAVANEMKKSLPGAIQILIDAALKVGTVGSPAFNRAMMDMIGGGTRTAKTIDALTQHMGEWTNGVAKISAGMKSGATDVNGWALAQSGFNIQMDRTKAALAAAAISIGTLLLPALTHILAFITPLITAFASWAVGIMKNKTALAIIAGVLAGLATIILIAVVPAFIAWAVAALSASVAMFGVEIPIILIGILIGALVALIIVSIQHWGAITTWLGNVWNTVITWMGNVWKTVSTHIGGLFDWLGSKVHIFIVAWQFEFAFIGAQFSAFGTAIHNVINGIGNAFSALGSLVRGVWNGIVGAVKGAINFIIGLINGFIQGIDAISVHVGPINIGFSIPTIPYLASGGYITSPGLAYLHAGETVMPARAGVQHGGGHGPITVNMPIYVQQLDPHEIDRVTGLLADKLRAQFGNI